MPIAAVVVQHAEEVATLRHTRSVMVRAPHIGLFLLRRHDNRIAAHLDGLAVAGGFGAQCCADGLQQPTAGPVFAAAVNAIARRDATQLEQLLATAGARPDAARGLVSAFGWVSAQLLQGLVYALLAPGEPTRQTVGMAACRLQQVDPGVLLRDPLASEHVPLRTEAIRAAAALGRVDALDLVRTALQDPATAQAAAQAMCLLGERAQALPVLEACALGSQPCGRGTRLLAWMLLVQALDLESARQKVRRLAQGTASAHGDRHLMLQVCGLLGDVQLVPWMIEHMGDDRFARRAGEAFMLITGADLAAHALERPGPPQLEDQPDDTPTDDNVALAEDDNLPWPDPVAVHAWWKSNASRLPSAGRCFMGASVSIDHCEAVLRTGTQRQRVLAAHWLCLLQPGRKLFNIAAPAWRQQRLLGIGP